MRTREPTATADCGIRSPSPPCVDRLAIGVDREYAHIARRTRQQPGAEHPRDLARQRLIEPLGKLAGPALGYVRPDLEPKHDGRRRVVRQQDPVGAVSAHTDRRLIRIKTTGRRAGKDWRGRRPARPSRQSDRPICPDSRAIQRERSPARVLTGHSSQASLCAGHHRETGGANAAHEATLARQVHASHAYCQSISTTSPAGDRDE